MERDGETLADLGVALTAVPAPRNGECMFWSVAEGARRGKLHPPHRHAGATGEVTSIELKILCADNRPSRDEMLAGAHDPAARARIRAEHDGAIDRYGDDRDLATMEKYLKVLFLVYHPMGPEGSRCVLRSYDWGDDPMESPPTKYIFLRGRGGEASNCHYDLFVDSSDPSRAIFDRLHLSVEVERAYGRGSHPLCERTVLNDLPARVLRDAGLEPRGEAMHDFCVLARDNGWGSLPDDELDAATLAFLRTRRGGPPAADSEPSEAADPEPSESDDPEQV